MVDGEGRPSSSYDGADVAEVLVADPSTGGRLGLDSGPRPRVFQVLRRRWRGGGVGGGPVDWYAASTRARGGLGPSFMLQSRSVLTLRFWLVFKIVFAWLYGWPNGDTEGAERPASGASRRASRGCGGSPPARFFFEHP
jgi:hypothetical protein